MPKASGGEAPIAVTGTRIATPNLRTSATRDEGTREDSEIVTTGSRVSPVRRGDWNACTVDDPSRGRERCRNASGKAATDLAEGLRLAWQGDTDEAIAAFDRAIAGAPKSSIAYLNRGLAYRRRGDLEHALADLDRAVKYAPQEARNYYVRSLILRAQGDVARARHDEDRAVELDPAYDGIVPGR